MAINSKFGGPISYELTFQVPHLSPEMSHFNFDAKKLDLKHSCVIQLRSVISSLNAYFTIIPLLAFASMELSRTRGQPRSIPIKNYILLMKENSQNLIHLAPYTPFFSSQSKNKSGKGSKYYTKKIKTNLILSFPFISFYFFF